MKFSKGRIIVDRELSELDKFTIDFINILQNFSDYVIVSGYVSILLGRARASEDIDIIIPKMGTMEFSVLVKELKKNDFYCLNASTPRTMYEYFQENLAIRFAKEGTAIPNIEIKFARTPIDREALKTKIKIIISRQSLYVSNMELQIAFKEKILQSPKDLEDARHLRNITKNLNRALLKKYEGMLSGY